jgi:stearoyl-CoA desaturase (delta-9 desaturase)
MSFIENILETPSYGWSDENGNLIKPSKRQLFKEFFSRLNIFKSKKNWLAFTSWSSVIALLPFVVIFVIYHFSFLWIFIGFLYGMFVMGSHGTIWYHRYSTHQAYTFKNKFWRFLTQNLVPKMIPEEIYVVSHHVHHAKSDTPGDPYNANGGWLYCFLADVNHQPIARNLSEEDYKRVAGFMKHTGVKCNTYKQYQTWGSVSHPLYTIVGIVLNLTFWYFVFYFIGGNLLACTLLGGAFFWAVGVRTFNFNGHGRGKNIQNPERDFNHKDRSVNQNWPGIVAGEWHNNHHLFPSSARAGFLSYQIDLAWYYIYFLYLIGGVTSYNNSKKLFIENYYKPFKKKLT